jgi:hypothetical protein
MGQKTKPGLILKTSGANFSPIDETNIMQKLDEIKNRLFDIYYTQ